MLVGPSAATGATRRAAFFLFLISGIRGGNRATGAGACRPCLTATDGAASAQEQGTIARPQC